MRSVLRDKDHLVLHRKKSVQHSRSRTSSVAVEGERTKKKDQITTGGERNSTTALSRLIESWQYAAAIQRLHQYPKEVSVWICCSNNQDQEGKASSNSSSDAVATSTNAPCVNTCTSASRVSTSDPKRHEEYVLIRQLPIHLACGNLFREDTTSSIRKAQLESLIVLLVAIYPKSCLKRDQHGQLPLHQALIHKASSETIMSLLCAAPSTISQLDRSNRTPVELNQLGSCEVLDEANQRRITVTHLMLTRDESFWNKARQEAVFRLKHRIVPSAGASIGSMSVMAASLSCDDDSSTLVTKTSSSCLGSKNSSCVPPPATAAATITTSSTVLEPLKRVDCNAWSQLEKRAIYLGKRLVESCEKNHEVRVKLCKLEVALKQLKEKYSLLAETDPAQRVMALEIENDRLKARIRELEAHPQPTTTQERNKEEARSTPAETNDKNDAFALLQKERNDLKAEVQELKKSNQEYKDLLNWYEGLLSNSDGLMSCSSSIDHHQHHHEAAPKVESKDENDADNAEVDSIILCAEQLYGRELRKELVEAWNSVTIEGPWNNHQEDNGSEVSELESNEQEASSFLKEAFEACREMQSLGSYYTSSIDGSSHSLRMGS